MDFSAQVEVGCFYPAVGFVHPALFYPEHRSVRFYDGHDDLGHISTEFFELVKEHLNPGGTVIVNAGHPEGNNDLEEVLSETMSEVFPTVIRDPLEDTNTLIVASEAQISADNLRAAIPGLPEELRPVAAEAVDRIEPRLEGGTVYTDDKAPVEWLIDRSILGYAADN